MRLDEIMDVWVVGKSQSSMQICSSPLLPLALLYKKKVCPA